VLEKDKVMTANILLFFCAVGIGFLIWVNRNQAARISDLEHDLKLLKESLEEKRRKGDPPKSNYRKDRRVVSWVDLDDDG
jgi:hypothetical protein